VEALEGNTRKYQVKQRSFFENGLRPLIGGGAVRGLRVDVGVEGSGGRAAAAAGRWLRGGWGGELGGGLEEIGAAKPADKKRGDKLRRVCEACGGREFLGSNEWEAHLSSKQHKIRGSKKWREKQENKERHMKKGKGGNDQE
jgi:hypothetical protein